VLLNAAAVFSVEDGDWQRGLATAAETIDSGAALDVLERWIARTQRAHAGASSNAILIYACWSVVWKRL
jgi:hypothetical protein